jgi:hypothetical protein
LARQPPGRVRPSKSCVDSFAVNWNWLFHSANPAIPLRKLLVKQMAAFTKIHNLEAFRPESFRYFRSRRGVFSDCSVLLAASAIGELTATSDGKFTRTARVMSRAKSVREASAGTCRRSDLADLGSAIKGNQWHCVYDLTSESSIRLEASTTVAHGCAFGNGPRQTSTADGEPARPRTPRVPHIHAGRERRPCRGELLNGQQAGRVHDSTKKFDGLLPPEMRRPRQLNDANAKAQADP